MTESPHPEPGDEDDELDDGCREVDRDRCRRVRADEERRRRPLDHEEERQTHPQREAALAAARDEVCDDGVDDREDVGDRGNVGEGSGATWIDAIEDARQHEKDRREQHENDDRTKRPCHLPLPLSRARMVFGQSPAW